MNTVTSIFRFFQKNSRFSLVLFIALFTVVNCTYGQSGAWIPAHYSASFPRIVLDTSHRTNARANFTSQLYSIISSGIYQSAIAPIPTDNTESSNRRERARVAKNTAFVVYINYKSVQNQVDTLSIVESDSLKKRVLLLLNSLNTAIPAISIANPNNYNDWQWRTKDMIDYLCAYDLLKGANVPDSLLLTAKANLQKYAGNLYREATRSFFGLTFFSTVKNNHALMVCGALGVAAVTLNDATSIDNNEQPINWISAALWNMDNILWRDAARQSDSTSIAGYAEGPYYLRYAMLNCIPFMRGIAFFLRDTTLALTFNGEERTITNLGYDRKYTNLWNWIYSIMLPNGTLPPIGDTYVNTGFPELALVTSYGIRLQGTSNSILSVANQLNSTVDMRANYIAVNSKLKAVLEDDFLTVFPKSGDVVFRSSRNSNALYMHICGANGLARTSGAGHNQADVSSFMMYRGGEPIARDGGYINYTRRGEIGNATNHNMILVDGAGPIIGAPAQPNDADGFIENSVDLPSLHYSEVRTNYLATDISRSFLFVRKSYFMNADFMNAKSPHSYTWQFHSGGKNEKLISTTDNAYFRSEGFTVAIASANSNGKTPMTFALDSAVHETGYNATAKHVVLLAKTSPVKKTAILALLSPIDSAISRNQVLNGETNFATAEIIDTLAKRRDYFTTQADTLLVEWNTQSNTIRTDARFGYWSFPFEGGNVTSAFMRDGQTLKSGNTTIIEATPRMNVAIDYSNDTLLRVNASKAGEIILETSYPIKKVNGNTIVSWKIIPQKNMVSVVVTAPISFDVELTKSTLSAGIRSYDNSPQISKFYPNPAATILTVHCEGINPQSSLRLINMMGIEQLRMDITPSFSTVQHIPLETVGAGVYQLVLIEGERVVSAQKVVIIR